MVVLSTPGFAFSLISWLFLSQSGHTMYRIKAEYLIYQMVPVILLLVICWQTICIKENKLTFFSTIVFSVDSLFNIWDRLLKFSVVLIDILMEGTVSQILFLGLYLGPSLYFMSFQK